jgi:hypothetical protein
MLTGGLPFSVTLPLSECVVPQGINGPVAIWVTSDDQALNGNAVQRQSNAIVAGPLLTFIDIQVDVLSESVRSKGKGSGSGSGYGSGSGSGYGSGSGSVSSFTSTTTVAPSMASAMVSGLSLSTSASATPSPSPSGAPGAIVNGLSMVPAPTSSSA